MDSGSISKAPVLRHPRFELTARAREVAAGLDALASGVSERLIHIKSLPDRGGPAGWDVIRRGERLRPHLESAAIGLRQPAAKESALRDAGKLAEAAKTLLSDARWMGPTPANLDAFEQRVLTALSSAEQADRAATTAMFANRGKDTFQQLQYSVGRNSGQIMAAARIATDASRPKAERESALLLLEAAQSMANDLAQQFRSL